MAINPLEIVINYDRDLVVGSRQGLSYDKEAVLAFERRGHGIVLKSRSDEHSIVPRIFLISYNGVRELRKDAYLRKKYGTLIDAMGDYMDRCPSRPADSYHKFAVHDGFFLAYPSHF